MGFWGDFERRGERAASGWLRVVWTVLADDCDAMEPKDVVAGDFRGVLFCVGRLFCSFAVLGLLSPLETLTGDLCDATPRVCRRRFVVTVRGVSLRVVARSKRLAMSLTRPRDGSCTGWICAGLERTLLI